jgi:YbbR domain-containing protein
VEKTTRFQRGVRFTRNALSHNLGLKLVSVLLAFFLWFAVTGGPKSERKVVTHLDLTNYIPDGFALADTYTSDFQVRLSGRDTAIQRLENSEVSFSLERDAIEPKAGTQQVRIDTEDVVTRSGLTVNSVTPNQIIISLDEEYSVRRAVKVSLIGNLPPEFDLFIDPPRVNPESIEVSGARRLVEQHEILYATLDLQELSITEPAIITRRVIIEPSPLLTYETREVEVELDVIEVTAEKSFTLDRENVAFIGINEGNETVNPNFQPGEFIILVKGPRTWVENLEADTILMQIDLTGAPRGERFELELRPTFVRFRDPHPRLDDLVDIELMMNNKTLVARIDRR